MYMKVMMLSVVVYLVGFVTACDRNGTKVNFLLDWKGDPTYAGVYIARELGYFHAEGLELDITEGSGGSVAAQVIGVGTVHWIGTSSGSASVIARSRDVHIVVSSVLYPEIPTVIFSNARTPISTPADLRGKRIGLVSGSVTVDEYHALLAANNIDAAGITEIGVANDPTPLLTGQVDALIDYGELLPTALRAGGFNIADFRLAKFGVKMYGLDVIVNQARWDDPQYRNIAQRVTKAINRGYEFLRERPEEAANVYLRVFPEKDPRYVTNSIKIVALELGNGPIGAQASNGWDKTVETLLHLHLIANSIPSTELMATE
jgi:ABC-type nitrate/sulfonate/bicarbonate transport system substrate-binding protein